MTDKYKYIPIAAILISFSLAKDGSLKDAPASPDPFRRTATAKIGDNPFPTNPMSDRAKGFIDQGRVKSAISNYGAVINWDVHPAGIWGE